MILKLGMKHQAMELFKVCINHDPGMKVCIDHDPGFTSELLFFYQCTDIFYQSTDKFSSPLLKFSSAKHLGVHWLNR